MGGYGLAKTTNLITYDTNQTESAKEEQDTKENSHPVPEPSVEGTQYWHTAVTSEKAVYGPATKEEAEPLLSSET